MATTITAGNATNGAAISSDSTGILELKSGTGSGTTAMTVGTDQAVTFAQAANLPNTFGFKNRIINGAMVIDQRNAGASVTVNGNAPYVLDRYFAQDDTDGVFTIQQSSVAPSGFTNSMLFTVTTADASLGATQLARITQRIEGFNVADLGWGSASAQTVTLSFWVRSSVTGTFGGSLANSAANRSYPFSYSISSANTWEQKSITIAGDTSGTWLTNNGIGIELNISLAAGSTYSGTAGAWSGSLFFNATGATNLMATNGATFYITGVQLEKGSTATSFDYRPYGTELQLCQRYCFKMSTTGNFGPYGMGHGVGTTSFRVIIKTAQTMRAQPTLAFTTASGFQWSFGNALSAIAAADYGVDAFSIDCTSTGLAANGGYLLTSANNTTSSITATAEL